MAKITITFEDLPDGTIGVDGDPTPAELHKMAAAGLLRGAGGYAAAAWALVLELSQTRETQIKASETAHHWAPDTDDPPSFRQ